VNPHPSVVQVEPENVGALMLSVLVPEGTTQTGLTNSVKLTEASNLKQQKLCNNTRPKQMLAKNKGVARG